MSDETTSKSGRTWLYVLGLLVGLPLCYLLSCGPVVVLYHRGVLSFEMLQSAYAPLGWLEQHGFFGAIDSYVRVWMTVTGTKER